MRAFYITLLSASLLAPHFSFADVSRVKSSLNREESEDKVQENLILPYFFSTDTLGFNLGVGAMAKGYHQEQMTIGGTVFKGDVSDGLYAGLFNYRIANSQRWYLSASGMKAYFPDQRAYTGGIGVPLDNNTSLPGSNDSSNEQFLEANGDSDWLDVKLEYALPFGATKNNGIVEYRTRNGLLVSKPSGGKTWNPLESGAMVATLRYFSRYQSFELSPTEIDGDMAAFEYGLLYDNTDFAVNPSYGSRQYLAYSESTSWGDDTYDWNLWQFSASKFISFGQSDYAHQRILAMNFWTAYSPSWELDDLGDGTSVIRDAAPYNEGATLGGFKRMRGYDFYRFHDKAAIYGALEYRYTLKYNPVKNINWLRFLKLDWFQLVAFAEAGRVAPSYTLNNFSEDLKFDYGVSLRAMMAGLVVRTELANSPEGTNFWIMVDQPF